MNRIQSQKNQQNLTVPPQSIEAEESILSSLLIDNSSLLDIVEILSPDDFYKSAHQKIYSAVLDLFSKNEPVDLVTLTNLLREKAQLEETGGAAYLAWLMDSVPLAVNAPHYAKIIHDKACLRRLIEKANLITRRCFENSSDVDDVLDYAETSIFEISENKIRPSFYSLGKIIESNIDELEERQGNKSLISGVATGFRQFDNLTSGLQNSDLIILAARPSMGKTAFALNIARNAAIDGKVPTAIFSLEMSKEQLSMRLLCAESRVDSSRIRTGFFSKDDWQKLTQAASILTDAPIYIDDSADLTAIEIRAKARRLKMEKGLGLIIIDYLQLMQGRKSVESRRDLEISEISRSMKALAKEISVPVIGLSQLNRKLEERSDKRPQMSDLRESGALEQDADLVVFIYRDEVYNKKEDNPNNGKAEIIIAKQRNGPIGTATLAFLKTYTRFESLASDHGIPDMH
ncbi:MAG: replicative DNA helicase [Desulfobacterales bacterium]|nr:replicative DNA helicase [Desulfobacterales bacterium]MDD4071220.1 replicative DNA helicase [Desulfobacterales bacterium]MDD4392228.1 replicative DNA helicase [Desulfobacterales bacterium]